MFASAEISERQREIYEFAARFQQENGFPPTVREIGSAIGSSPATVQEHLGKLEQAGLILRRGGKKRALWFLGEEELPSRSALPLLGQVAAGAPLLADEHIEDYVEVPAQMRRGGVEFLVRARGDSMIEAGIIDGDLLIVQQRESAVDGEIVVALAGEDESCDEATVKYFFQEPGRVRLQPANSAYEPLYPAWLRLLGRVTGQFRSY